MKTPRLLTLTLLFTTALAPFRAAAEGLERELPPPDFYARNADALGLSEAQKDRLRETMQRAESQFREVREQMGSREAALREAVADASKSEDEVMPHLRAMLETEAKAKAVQFRAQLTLRRLLTPEQWEKARPLIAQAGAKGGGPSDEMRARLQERFEQVRSRAQEIFRDSAPPEEFQRTVREVEERVKAGDPEGARKMLERILQELEKERVKRGK